MRSLARAIRTLFQTPLYSPLETRIAASKVFADNPPSPGAVLTTLDRCPLNIDLHWRSPHEIKFALVLVLATATYHRQLWTYLLTAVPNVGNLHQIPLSTQGRSDGVWDWKGDWALTAPGGIATKRVRTANQIFLIYLDSRLPVKGQIFRGFAPALMSCTPRLKSWIWLVFYIEDISYIGA